MSPEVVLYGRPECHLCDEARAAIVALGREVAGLRLREVNIEDDDALLRRYLERIPVVAVNGSVVSELVVDVDAVRASLDTLGT